MDFLLCFFRIVVLVSLISLVIAQEEATQEEALQEEASQEQAYDADDDYLELYIRNSPIYQYYNHTQNNNYSTNDIYSNNPEEPRIRCVPQPVNGLDIFHLESSEMCNALGEAVRFDIFSLNRIRYSP